MVPVTLEQEDIDALQRRYKIRKYLPSCLAIVQSKKSFFQQTLPQEQGIILYTENSHIKRSNIFCLLPILCFQFDV